MISAGLARTGEVSQAEHATRVGRVVAAYEQIVARAHAHSIRVIGATITPYVGSDYYHPGPLSEADRQAVNAWIRSPGHFDAVIDFDAVVRDPRQPDRLLPAYDCGDHLHPSAAGYKAMGESVPRSRARLGLASRWHRTSSSRLVSSRSSTPACSECFPSSQFFSSWVE